MNPTVMPGDRLATWETDEFRRLAFRCPACNQAHWVQVELKNGSTGPLWSWNGSMAAPTFSPSVMVTGAVPGDPRKRCHSYVVDGWIEFYPDSEHSFAGQKVELTAWENES